MAELVSGQDDARHQELIDDMLCGGNAAYIAYDPYLVDDFIVGHKTLEGIDKEYLPMLDTMTGFDVCKKNPVKRAYCFEDGIIVEFKP